MKFLSSLTGRRRVPPTKGAATKTRRSSRRRWLLAESLESRRLLAVGPFSPAAEQPGSTAIDAASDTFVGFATRVAEFVPGANVDPQFQTPLNALGISDTAGGNAAQTVSLGSGGQITVEFAAPIEDRPGPDFAVFENSFSDTFLELGFVEVSSDGVEFVRFDTESLTTDPVGSFGTIDPTNIDGFAGNFRAGFGTGFDLADLDTSGTSVNINAITQVRIVDVVGDGSVVDSTGDPIFDPFPTTGSAGFDLDAIGVIHQADVLSSVVDFEDVGPQLGPGGFFAGPAANGVVVPTAFGDSINGTIQSENLSFTNNFLSAFEAFDGFAFSNVSDTTTPGFTNQFASFTGAGAGGSEFYAVGFVGQATAGGLPTISLAEDDTRQFESIEVTNTTFTALSLLNGDQFADPFGGPSGDEPDQLTLSISGLDAEGNLIGEVEFVLADFTFDDNTQDFVIDEFTTVDLSPIAQARALQFNITSTDVGEFGINTPAYFAIDDIVLNEPLLAAELTDGLVDESAGTTATSLRLSRSASFSDDALVVDLTTDNPDLFSLPAQVTIPAGTAEIVVPIGVVDNDSTLENPSVSITAAADGFDESTVVLQIINDDLALSIGGTLSANEADGTAELTITRQTTNTASELEVLLGSNDPTELTVPTSVTIPFGATSATVNATIVADQLFDGDQVVEISASADGFIPTTANFTVNDVDVAELTLSVADSVSEDAGTLTATIARNAEDTSEGLFVDLQSSQPSVVTVAPVAVIPPGSQSVEVELTIVDNDVLGDSLNVMITASTDSGLTDQQTIQVVDDEPFAPAIEITIQPTSLSESDAPVIVDFETIGATLPDQSTLGASGPAGSNLFNLGPVTLTNEVGDFGFSGGFAITNSTDDTTPDFTNLFGNVTGGGSLGSSTFAIASAFPSPEANAPTITLNDLNLSFESIQVTNTTFAAAVIENGNAFAEPFGGETGDDPDVFTLTIEGFDSADQPVGSVDFLLADFSFDDNSQDFIVDEFVTVDLTSLVGATALSFSLDSTDQGPFGINTPAFFAIDNLVLASGTPPAAVATVTRVNTDVDQPLEISLQVSDASELSLPGLATIAEGSASVTFPVDVVNDAVVDGDQIVTVTASAEGLPAAAATVTVQDDDQLSLVFTVAPDTVSEDASAATAVISRNEADLSAELIVQLQSDAPESISVPETITIPAGARSVGFELAINDNDVLGDSEMVILTASAADRPAITRSVTVIDDDQFEPALFLSIEPSVLSESDAPLTIGFEDLGATLADESFDNGSDLAGGFTSGPVTLNNDFNTEFGSFSSFAISNVTDNVTPDFTNLFGNITGGGALGSSTFAIASAFPSPGTDAPTITLNDPSLSFASVQVTNTTFAAAVIENGNAFAEPFGGETGDDPDVFSLTIAGFDDSGLSVGTVDFVLADFRFEDNSLDFIVDEFVTVDLTSLVGATSLTFALDSTDVGPFGINTPTFFAIDNLVLAAPESDAAPAMGTVTRINADTSQPLEVVIGVDNENELAVPTVVTIPAGEDQADFAIDVLDDFVVDGDQTVSLNVAADGFFSATQTVTVEDNDVPTLTVSLSSNEISEASLATEALLVTHNLAVLSEPLVISAAVSGDGASLGEPIVIPAGARSTTVPINAVDDRIAQGNRVVEISLQAENFPDATVAITVTDDDVLGIITSADQTDLVVTELIEPGILLISLASQPLGPVTIEIISPSDQILLPQSAVTFTPDNFDQPQPLSVIGVVDLVLEPTEPIVVELVATDNNPSELFDGITTTVNVSLVDFAPDEIQISEADNFVVVSEPVLGLTILDETLESGITVEASNAPQTILIEPLPNVRGPVIVGAGGGDDVVTLQSDRFTLIDGGDGIDTLSVQLDGTVNLLDLIDQQVFGFEQYEFSPLETDQLEILIDPADLNLLVGPEGTLQIETLAGASLGFVGDTATSMIQFEDGRLIQTLMIGDFEIQVETFATLQNVANLNDVDNSGTVTPLDALLIINQLADGIGTEVPPIDSLDQFEGFFDVSGDNLITPLDALLVINTLIEQAASDEPTDDEVALQSIADLPAGRIDRAIEELFVIDDDEESEFVAGHVGLMF